MFLSRFRVRGYKCLEDVEVSLTPIHVFIGPGDSGKTSLLEAISAFYGRFKTPAAEWFPQPAGPGEFVTYGSRAPAIDLAGEWSETVPGGTPLPVAGFGYSILVPEKGNQFGVTDQWVRPPAGQDPRMGLARTAISFPRGATVKQAEDRAAEAAFRQCVQAMLRPAPVYRFDPRRLAEAAPAGSSQIGLLAADGYGLPVLLDQIARQNPLRWAEIQAAFCRILPHYKSLGFSAEAWTPPKKRTRADKPAAEDLTACGLVLVTCTGRKIPASRVSPGVLLLLIFLTLPRLPEPPPLVLIETPEQGLYPQWLASVIEPLKQASRRPEGGPFSQVILTTHSPAVLNFFSPDEVTLLRRSGEKPDAGVAALPLASMEAICRQHAGGKGLLGDLWSELGGTLP